MPDAIQQDAPQELIAPVTEPTEAQATDETPAERPLSARERAMAEISNARRDQISDEVGAPIAVSEEAAAPVVAESHDDQIEAQLAPSVIADGFDKVRVRAKIDGEEVEVALDQVMRQYQKHSTADRRLAEATRLLKDAQERVQAAPIAQLNEDAATAPQDTTTKDFLSALFAGDEDMAAQALDKLVQGRQQHAPIPDAQALAAQVRQQIEVESALSGFAKDFADVCSDPYLANMADQHLEANLQAGIPFAEALQAAGQDVRGWLRDKTGAVPAEPTSTTRTERLERKAGIDAIRTANVTAASQAAQPRSEEQLRADALAQLISKRPGMTALR